MIGLIGNIYMRRENMLVNGIEATIVLARCKKTGKLYGNRVEKKSDGKWHFTWSFKINEENAKKERFESTIINGEVVLDSEYKGCPHCGTRGWFTCGNCGRLTCNDTNTGVVSCKWCGNTGELEQGASEFSISGGEI